MKVSPKHKIKITCSVPSFLGTDLNLYGPYVKGDIVALPEKYASLIVRKKMGKKTTKKPRKVKRTKPKIPINRRLVTYLNSGKKKQRSIRAINREMAKYKFSKSEVQTALYNLKMRGYIIYPYKRTVELVY